MKCENSEAPLTLFLERFLQWKCLHTQLGACKSDNRCTSLLCSSEGRRSKQLKQMQKVPIFLWNVLYCILGWEDSGTLRHSEPVHRSHLKWMAYMSGNEWEICHTDLPALIKSHASAGPWISHPGSAIQHQLHELEPSQGADVARWQVWGQREWGSADAICAGQRSGDGHARGSDQVSGDLTWRKARGVIEDEGWCRMGGSTAGQANV